MARRADIERASLSATERRAMERIVDALRERLGEDLVAVWLYGSRSRGEAPGPESDIDLMIVAEGGRARHWRDVCETVEDVASDCGSDPLRWAPKVVDPDWLDERRAIESFFIREFDRDKIVLTGEG